MESYFAILAQKRQAKAASFRRPAADAGDRTRPDGRPRILILDEPSLGLSPVVVKDVRR